MNLKIWSFLSSFYLNYRGFRPLQLIARTSTLTLNFVWLCLNMIFPISSSLLDVRSRPTEYSSKDSLLFHLNILHYRCMMNTSTEHRPCFTDLLWERSQNARDTLSKNFEKGMQTCSSTIDDQFKQIRKWDDILKRSK